MQVELVSQSDIFAKPIIPIQAAPPHIHLMGAHSSTQASLARQQNPSLSTTRILQSRSGPRLRVLLSLRLKAQDRKLHRGGSALHEYGDGIRCVVYISARGLCGKLPSAMVALCIGALLSPTSPRHQFTSWRDQNGRSVAEPARSLRVTNTN